mmetsp:Transcript_9065/g.13371  ORF Transcript_9065/g.13371 Transcript_9065/m.13371 type:complete len:326 (-) Transcript_9065:523-1500(-)
MKIVTRTILAALVAATATDKIQSVSAFVTPVPKVGRTSTTSIVAKGYSFQSKLALLPSSSSITKRNDIFKYSTALKSTNNDAEEGGGLFKDIQINIPYLLGYIAFLSFATYGTMTLPAENSEQILNAFFSDPNYGLNNINNLFSFIWQILGLYALPLACLIMPGARNQKLPATPFVIGTAFGGYGILGIYASTLKKQQEEDVPMTKSDLGWFTANVLENKLVNAGAFAFLFYLSYTTGFANALTTQPEEMIQGYMDLFQSAAIVAASSFDLVILSTVAASLIPGDLKRRGVVDSQKANLAALSTLLLPAFGLFAYVLLRPTMEEE